MVYYEPTVAPKGADRLRIEPDEAVGFYTHVWLTPESASPEKDFLQDTLEVAKEECLEEFGVPLAAWTARDDARL